MKPLIAVCGSYLAAGRVSRWRNDALAAPVPYLHAIRRAGGREAVVLPDMIDDSVELLSRFDGLMMIGGPDVDPSLYGEEAVPETYGVRTASDLFEMDLIRTAAGRGMPVLAICRGVQVMNVAFGGTLHQHLPAMPGTQPHGTPGTNTHGGVKHRVTLTEGSLAAEAMGSRSPECSSHHHQAVAVLGAGLKITGKAEDGVVEALEMNEGWVVGVQWHPEDTAASDPAQQGLFDALVSRAAKQAAKVPV